MIWNALTVDVEEFFHAENLARAYPRERWDEIESRVDDPLERLLEVLRARSVRATFFVLGWLAERRPWIVRSIASAGHEVASHGYGHELLTRLDPGSFAADVRRATAILTPLAGRRPRGYRAPCFTVVAETRWALDVLAEQGFAYDSSVFPVHHDRYGDPEAPREPHVVDPGRGARIVEAPPATLRALGRNWPVAGGGWLRLLPWRLCALGIEELNARGAPAVVYLHPWEIDEHQPSHQGAGRLARLRHGIGTGRLLGKLERLLDRFSFAPLETVLERMRFLEPASPVVRVREKRSAA